MKAASRSTGKRVKILVSIDTEEDNWKATREDIQVENIRALPEAHDFMTGLGLRPTYFCDYPVVSTPWSAQILRALDRSGQCEIGAHLHPWNTPPLEEPFSDRNTMMKNLPASLQQRKLETLSQALRAVTGKSPVSFRAGRFGLAREGVRALIALGYRVDSSVTPFVDWTEFSNGADYSEAPFSCYRLDGESPVDQPVPGGSLCELPVSCGFTRHPFGWRGRAFKRLRHPTLRPLRLTGLGAKSGWLRRVVGSPETDELSDLLRLARCLIEQGVGYVHLFFHSPSLVPGYSPFVQTEADLAELRARLAGFVEGVSEFADLEPMTISEAAEAIG